ncbi:MAG: ABC transporter permease [Bacteroidetes bacterium]|nr:ABC transporter permease [Bacteroidota bacterium]
MNYELFIVRRIAFSKEGGTFISRPIIWIAMAGVALGFAVMVIALAIVTGFKKEIREKVIGFGSHIQVSNYDENNSYETKPISKDQHFLTVLRSDPAIEHIQAFATKAGIIKTKEDIEGVVAKGIDRDFDWSFFSSRMVEGRIMHFQDSARSNEVVISKQLSQKLRLKTGDDLVMYFIQQPPRVRKFQICGIYETGLEEFDNLYLFCDLAQIQKLNDWNPEQIGGFEIKIKNFDELDQIGQKVYAASGSELNAKTIKEIYPQIFDWLDLQNINAIIIITLMIIVAGINMISALLIIILERVKMIGTLKALGTRNINIRKIFIYISGFLLFRGLIVGNIIGIGLCLLQKKFQWIHLDQESYYISHAPISLDPFHILVLNLGTLVICTAMLVIPSMIVSRISPIQALRYS